MLIVPSRSHNVLYSREQFQPYEYFYEANYELDGTRARPGPAQTTVPMNTRLAHAPFVIDLR